MTAAFAVLGFSLSFLQDTLYEAEGQVILSDPRSSGGIANEIGIVLDPSRYVRNQAEVMRSPQVSALASAGLGGDPSPGEIEDNTTISAAADRDSVIVRGTQPTPDAAMAMVDAVVAAYEQTVVEGVQQKADNSIQTLEASKTEWQSRIDELDAELSEDPDNPTLDAQRAAAITEVVAIEARIEEISTSAALYGSGVQLYVQPDVPESPVQPLPLRNAAIAAILGLIVSGAWAWWRAERDERADDRNLPARVLQAPLLAVVPEFSEADVEGPAPTVNAPGSTVAEAYQFAISSLGFSLGLVEGKTVLITSASPGDGKSVTALNLAVAATKDGRRPMLIDADERERGLTRMAGFRDEEGIADLGSGADPASLIHDWSMFDGTSIRFVPAGRDLEGNTASYFRSVEFRERFPKLTVDSDVVIIDSPPVMSAAETTDLAAQVDGVVLVVPMGASLRDVDDARVRLSLSGAPILGYVFNRARRGGTHGYGHGYGYGYGQPYGGGRHLRG